MRSVYSPYEGNSGAQLACSSADFLLNRLLYKSWGNFFPGFVLGWCQCFWSLLALTLRISRPNLLVLSADLKRFKL